MSKAKRTTIEVQGTAIGILTQPDGDYISLTDMVRNFDGAGALIEQWLKNKGTALLLGIWERINNPGLNSLEFEGINRRQNNPLRDPDRLREEDGRHRSSDAPRLCQPFAFSKSTVGLHPACRCLSIVN